MRRQPLLDAVRGLAILLVLAFHLEFATGVGVLDRMIRPVVAVGWAGVDLFFVLSGFLVGRIILAECARPDGFDRWRFLRRRMFRLWPVLFLYLGALMLLGGTKGVAMSLPVLLHIQNYAHVVPSHLWSLAVEEQFYLAATLLLPMLLARHGARGVAMALIVVMAASTGLRLWAWSRGVDPQIMQWRTHYRADSIALGVLMAWAEFYWADRFTKLVRHRWRHAALAVLGYAVLVALPTQRLRFGPGLIAADLASAALILSCYGAGPPTAFGTRWLAALGAIAYPLYVWHPSISQVAADIARQAGMSAPIVIFTVRFGVAVLVAALIASTIERPFIRLRDRSRPTSAPIPNLASN